MLIKKKCLFFSIMGVIIFLSGGFISIDWLRFVNKPLKLGFFESPFTPYMKIVVSFLCFVLVWITGKDNNSRSDIKKLKVAFTLIFIADLSFILKLDILGIGLFAICQIMLIYRNGAGFWKFLFSGGWIKYKAKLIIYSVYTMLICIGSLIFVFYPILKATSLFYIFVFYTIFLSISLWLALVSHEIGALPKRGAYLVEMGMSFFVFCDITVGFNLAIKSQELTAKTEFLWMVSSSLTWMFYTPALVLLAVSGYNFNKS